MDAKSVAFGAIVRGFFGTWGTNPSGRCQYTNVKTKLNKYDENCSLDTWKEEIIYLLQGTFRDVKNCYTKLWAVTADEKIEIITSAIKSITEKLIYAEQNFESGRLAGDAGLEYVDTSTSR
ncbi:hypothetical protein ERJ75_000103200 [Trypanosoma vivax]|nr:hypothetical protein ERJ75_000103200 [Trypanosoma vivax]